VWDELAPLMKGVKSADSVAFADLCVCVSRVRELEELVQKEGLILTDGAGGRRKHPALQVVREYRLSIQRWAGEFGLTPSSGTKIELFGERSIAGQSKAEKVRKPEAVRPGLLSGEWEETKQ
jgi:P27 family predicted phage terminase small subunit